MTTRLRSAADAFAHKSAHYQDQSAWVSIKLQDSSAKHGILPGQLSLSIDLQNDKRIIVTLLLL
jgi:hypothetical protein